MNPENLRSRMIDTIVEHSSDELETSDYINLAKESESELLDRVINILEYYKREVEELSFLVK